MNTTEELNTLLTSTLDFAAYRLPNANVSALYFTPEAQTIDASELGRKEGFLIAPFQHNNRYTLIPFSRDWSAVKPAAFDFKPAIKSTASSDYYHAANYFIEAMKASVLDKVILSRVEARSFDQHIDWPNIFNQLCAVYPKAFVYLFRTQTQGMWMGATPEQFLKVEDEHLSTVALAGTQPHSEAIRWSEKEKEEQQFVTQYIEQLYSKNNIDVAIEGPETVVAGPVAHLKTSFQSQDKVDSDLLAQFAKDLHPTPAVCGLPKEKALEYILSQEQHERACYCGFLGPIHRTDLNLFVNLRCMQIFKDQLALYIGGGLTKDSEAEQEWQETVEKAKTLLAIIESSQNSNP